MIWITYRDGRVAKYNNGEVFLMETDDWVRIAKDSKSLDKNEVIAKLRTSEILSLEYEQPCEVTFKANVIEDALTILLTRAKKITDWQIKGKLADLSRLLRKFNPQSRQWTK